MWPSDITFKLTLASFLNISYRKYLLMAFKNYIWIGNYFEESLRHYKIRLLRSRDILSKLPPPCPWLSLFKQCDQIGAPSVCGGPNSFNSITPQLPNSLTPQLQKSEILWRFLCAEQSGAHKNLAKFSDFRSYGVKELWS